jgi:hypothetical protein
MGPEGWKTTGFGADLPLKQAPTSLLTSKGEARLSQWDRSSFETPLTRLLEDGATPELPEGFVIDVKSEHWDQTRDIVGLTGI